MFALLSRPSWQNHTTIAMTLPWTREGRAKRVPLARAADVRCARRGDAERCRAPRSWRRVAGGGARDDGPRAAAIRSTLDVAR